MDSNKGRASRIITNLLVAGITMLAAGCGGSLPINSGADILSPTEQAMLDRHNEYRQGQGLAQLTANSKLNKIAQDQADYQAQHLNVGHGDKNGGNVGDRADGVGYLYLSIAENVGSASGGIQMFNDWLASAGHKANIEGADYTEIGVGVASIVGMQYWCVVFAKPQ